MPYTEYFVRQGDCISSIAFHHGFFPDTIWDDPKNSELREKRKDPNVLLPGDIVYIREKEQKKESCGTEKLHRFRRKGVPERLRVQFLDAGGTPRAKESYRLEVDGKLVSGETDDQGRIDLAIPPNAVRAVLVLGEAQDEFVFELGELDPIDQTTGIQGRLKSLGFYQGAINGQITAETKKAICAFQASKGLDVNGEVNRQTKDALSAAYGG